MFNNNKANVDEEKLEETKLEMNKEKLERTDGCPAEETTEVKIETAGTASLSSTTKKALVAGAAACATAGALLATPAIISAAGFGTTGIAPGSIGAGIMSKAATTGIGMGVVSALQSAGAAGLSTPTSLLIGIAGGTVGVGVAAAAARNSEEDKVGRMPATSDTSTNTEMNNVINNESESCATNTRTTGTFSGDNNVNTTEDNNSSKKKATIKSKL